MNLRLLLSACLLIATASAVEVGPAEALLIKRRESPTIRSLHEGQTLFAVANPGLALRSAGESVVWRRETFATIRARQLNADIPRDPQENLATAWDGVFAYLREHAEELAKEDIFEVEPELPAYDRAAPSLPAAAEAQAPAMPYWPQFQGSWGHLGDDYSQLHSAYELVRQQRSAGTTPVRIAILDIGFLPYHAAFPRNHPAPPFADIARDRRPADSGLASEPLFPPHTFLNGPSHGTATAAILAGPELTYLVGSETRHFSGGNPDAEIVPIRIGPTVAALPLPFNQLSRTGDVALGFVTAVQKQARVISMSVGGLPSNTLADAVNQAYDAGIPMFCAAGDFIYHQSGLKTPWYTAYPAAYENVMSVTGVTADRTPYGSPPAGNWSATKTSLLLGSFGPLDKMNNTVAGWGPNIPWAALPDYPAKPPYPTPLNSPWNYAGADWMRLDLDGQGTSANTPQVAATASLFLERYDGQLQSGYSVPWQRVEIVYEALRNAAEKSSAANRIFFGAGFLRARETLAYTSWSGAKALTPHRARNGFYWLHLLFSALLPLPKPDLPEAKQRAELGDLVAKLLPDLPPGAKPGEGYTQAVASAIELELAQHISASADIQELVSALRDPPDRAAQRAIVERLLTLKLSDPTRRFLLAVQGGA